MRARAQIVAVGGVCTLLLSGCGLSLQSLPKVGGIRGSTYVIHSQFGDVLNLPADAQVRVGAEVVGEVGNISTSNFEADVALDIKRNVRLVRGTTAQVRFNNPLGDDYVLLQPPTAAASAATLPAESDLPETETSTAPSVEDTFGALSLVLNGGGLEQLQTIIHELNDTFAGNQPQVRSLLGQINSAVTSLSGGKVAVDDALTAIGHLSTQLNQGSGTITTGIDDIGPAVGLLAKENGNLTSLLSSLTTLSGVATQVADQSGQNAVNDANDLVPVVDQLDSVEQQLAPDLGALQKFELTTPKVAPGDYLQVSVVANVILPPGDFDATAGSLGTTSTAAATKTDGAAITSLLGGGLLWTHAVIPRLVALVVVVVLGVYYIAFDILQYRIGAQPYPVSMMMVSAGGIYTGADVTYRGVDVGAVGTLDLQTAGVVAQLMIDPGVHIPANATASIRELSALGEQYVDLDPSSGSGPDLHAGSIIPTGRVTTPVPIGTTLINLGSLLNGINPADLRTLENFFITGFTGTGPGLRQIVVTGQQLFQALVAAQPGTTNLVLDGRSVLQTAKSTDGDFGTFAQGLFQLTGQLQSSNGDISSLIGNGISAEQQLTPFLATQQSAIAGVTTNLSVSAAVSLANQARVQELFQFLPVVAGDLGAVASGGQIRGELTINTANTVCPYLPASQVPAPSIKVADPMLDNGCATSAPDLLQRGAGTAPAPVGG